MIYNNNPQYGNNQQYYQGQAPPQQMERNQVPNPMLDLENQQRMAFAGQKGFNAYNDQHHNQKQHKINNNQQIYNVDQIQNNNLQANKGGLTDKSLRRGFIRKVLALICIQLIITFAFVIPSTLSDAYRDFQYRYRFILYIALVINIAVMFTLYCYRKQARRVPMNYILLFLFTVTEGYLISMLTAVSPPAIVLLCAGITFIIVFFITIYALTTKRDITKKVTAVFYSAIALLVLIIVGILFRDRIISTIIGVVIVGIFCFYLVYDIQRLQGNRTYAYSYDDYIIAALDIYIDIVVIFQTLLGIAANNS